jgi:hypothetical protein
MSGNAAGLYQLQQPGLPVSARDLAMLQARTQVGNPVCKVVAKRAEQSDFFFNEGFRLRRTDDQGTHHFIVNEQRQRRH